MRHLPLWIREGRKDPDFTTNPWEPLQPLLEVVARTFSVEAVILDAFGVCVAGTGPYKAGIGIRPPVDTALGHSLLSGGQTMVLNPREDAACLDCSLRDTCRDQANYTAPLEINGVIAGAVQIVAFDEEQRTALLERAEGTFLLIAQCILLLWRTKKLKPVFPTELPPDEPSLSALVGNSPGMLYLKETIVKAATAGGPVLISGESGTGKELVAAALHNNSPHKNGPFVPVNCGALPEALMESELFGYAPGAFSGAQSGGKKGLWEQADGGTIFLDEVSELPFALQVKLLRTIQDGQIRRVGDTKLIRANVRVVAATNRDLREEVRLGRFRKDLFYRLNVIPLFVPPLRDRKEDIRALSTHFIVQQATSLASHMVVVDQQLMRRFMEYHWPGNVRELKNFIEYGIHFSKDSTITWDLLADHFETTPASSAGPLPGKLRNARAGVSADIVRAALRKHGKSVAGKKAAAKELGISLATLYRALAQAEEDRAEAH
ncbi:sigma 54-interacting transcriptional regulator [Desulfovibrio sp. OttesenSCG-928-O18]|nr:sigma 54-interacting transcriptional regulator [Desulfovibrio sp. OttesenSCG-928-O18]